VCELAWNYDFHVEDESQPPLLVVPDEDSIATTQRLDSLWPNKLGFLCPSPHMMNLCRDSWIEMLSFHMSFVSVCHEVPTHVPFRSTGEFSTELDDFLECCKSSLEFVFSHLTPITLAEGRRQRHMTHEQKSREENEMIWLDVVFGKDSECAPGTTLATRLNILVAGISKALSYKEGSVQDRIRRYPYSYICSGAAARLLGQS